MKVFYEYDDVLCRCGTASEQRLRHRMLSARDADLSDLIKVGHWCPTDFRFREDSERAWIAEITWEEHRALLELWTDDPETDGSLPPSESVPENSELYASLEVLTSTAMMSTLLGECSRLAAEAGAERIPLPCPSNLDLDSAVLDILDRRFRLAWFRKLLNNH
jgi:hypothetical protein